MVRKHRDQAEIEYMTDKKRWIFGLRRYRSSKMNYEKVAEKDATMRSWEILKQINALDWMKCLNEGNLQNAMISVFSEERDDSLVPMIRMINGLAVKREWAEQEERTVCVNCVSRMGSFARRQDQEGSGWSTKTKHSSRKMGQCGACRNPFEETLYGVFELPWTGIDDNDLFGRLGATMMEEKNREGNLLRREYTLLGKTFYQGNVEEEPSEEEDVLTGSEEEGVVTGSEEEDVETTSERNRCQKRKEREEDCGSENE